MNEIQEIIIDHSNENDELDEVNELLKQGWILLGVFQRGYASDGETFYSTVYTVGRKA